MGPPGNGERPLAVPTCPTRDSALTQDKQGSIHRQPPKICISKLRRGQAVLVIAGLPHVHDSARGRGPSTTRGAVSADIFWVHAYTLNKLQCSWLPGWLGSASASIKRAAPTRRRLVFGTPSLRVGAVSSWLFPPPTDIHTYAHGSSAGLCSAGFHRAAAVVPAAKNCVSLPGVRPALGSSFVLIPPWSLANLVPCLNCPMADHK